MRSLLTILMVPVVLAQVAGADVWEDLAQYKMGDDPNPPPVAVNALIVKATAEDLGPIEDRLIAIVESTTATQEAKWFSCRMLQRVGTEKCVPVLASQLGDETMSHYARLTLERMTDSKAAGKALIKALGKVPDTLKIGIMGSLAARGDEKGVKPIARQLRSDNPAVSRAAMAALSTIGGKHATKAIAKAEREDVGAWAKDAGMLEHFAHADADVASELVMNGENPGIRSGAFVRLVALDEARAERVLADVLAEQGSDIRLSVIRGAMESGSETIRRGLVAALAKRPLEDQKVVLGAIADLHLVQYENDVLALLSNADDGLRDTVIRTLAVVGGEACFDGLYREYQRAPGKVVTDALIQLPVPAVDAKLMATVGEEGDVEKRLAALGPFVLRHPEGCVELLNTLVMPGQPEALRKAAMKSLQSVGNVASCKALVGVIAKQDALKKDAQSSVKRLSLALNQSDAIWREAFVPVLESADAATSEDLMAIMDGVATGESLTYLKKRVEEREDPLRKPALRALQRWPHFDAADVWVNIVADTNSVPETLDLAERSLKRILTRNEIKADADRKLQLAVTAIEQAPSLEFKQSILACYAKPNADMKGRMKKAFAPLVDDEDIGSQVQELLN